MNYIKEINAFYNKIVFQPLSGSAVSLWHALMHFNNLSGWKEKFSVAVCMLQGKSGLKATAFKTARTELQEKGYIIWQSQGSNRAAIYQIISQETDYHEERTVQPVHPSAEQESLLITPPAPLKPDHSADHTLTFVHTVDDTMDHTHDHKADRTSDHSPDPLFKQIHKQDQTKQNQPAADAVRFYQENFGVISPFIAEDIMSWINDMGEPLVLHAMKLAVSQGKVTWRYVFTAIELTQ
ncbi:DnaD domain-containing protein [Virgibacillus xinjiangensis]|uniref:DnaD domain-containing protein n=1 Tax=Virgibacillus xinjiangensis TaxID=393090 RepID=A0ABV7CZ77_9BACI